MSAENETSGLTTQTVFVQSTKQRVEIKPLNDREYRLTGTPADQPETGDKVVTDMTALEGIFAQLGLVKTGTPMRALQRALRPIWKTLEFPATEGWTRIATVNRW